MSRILLVEDNPGDQELIIEALEEWEHNTFVVDCASSLEEAKEKLSDCSCDIILTDLGLPDSSGIETFVSIRDVCPHIPIVVLTGLDNQKLALEAIALGAETYISKNNLSNLAQEVGFALARNIKPLDGEKIENNLQVKQHFNILSNAARRLKPQTATEEE